MAPRGPSKARDYDYSNVGTLGRRTGITLKEGRLDEHGMEEIEGMFSSPEKSPAQEDGFNINGNETTMGSDGMSMDEGNAPDPSDFLSGANSRRGSYFPPPVARSPMKTGLTGSPRRTPGLRSSPSPQHDAPSSSPSDGKGLGSGKGGSRKDVSPLTNRSINAPSSNHLNGTRRKNKANIKTSEPAFTVDFSDSDTNSQLNGDENTFEQIRHDFINNFDAGDQSVVGAEEPDQNDPDEKSFTSLASDSRKTEQPKPLPRSKKDVLGNRNKTQPTAQLKEADEQESTQKRKRPGRPPKSQRKDGNEVIEQRALKKAKTSDKKPQDEKVSLNPELSKVVENYADRAGPLKKRGLYILKREIPTESSATHTRSGRVSVRPLAYWKNERCVFGDGEAAEGQRYPLSTIREVIRSEEIEPEKKKTSKRRSSKKSRSRKNKDAESDEEEEEEDYADPWEKEGGVLHGYIRKWDPETQAGIEEEEVLDIAYAPSGIETRDVKDSTFRFAKLLSSSFLGSGVVELPPGGVKKPKNSKKMHMVFYVCHGRVQVDVSGVQFSAGKGCVFQVPRGNYYSFANTHQNDARLFFTQGCVPMENDGSGPALASKSILMEGDSPAEASRTTGSGKGRPKGKGKQKAGSKSKAS
ncbi:hypothetical protein ASPWEDRAFT_120584 [Aspergillus wentii DTO 134E9]|uniref:CENP-C homolog n=1 Tax=Aspergillus wentii DTO 134E9 TaxID=1073089 RepID=A0A1L9R745_ASPWE|nr:uncharacterized protein ASPWEDRAFT_120584 [Aspergillus wentii DTO 134E9]KAI9923685.1 hypothetical protein MW887_008418 [Aspergillus wentii]OJJ30729.1 hypothetical protein ASPWEDRAFT_120584 [Aspergillus wentii DTO 134E9]